MPGLCLSWEDVTQFGAKVHDKQWSCCVANGALGWPCSFIHEATAGAIHDDWCVYAIVCWLKGTGVTDSTFITNREKLAFNAILISHTLNKRSWNYHFTLFKMGNSNNWHFRTKSGPLINNVCVVFFSLPKSSYNINLEWVMFRQISHQSRIMQISIGKMVMVNWTQTWSL